MNIELLIIDPQNDFCDIQDAALAVPGGDAAMKRLAAFISNKGRRIKRISTTLDSHKIIDIGHPTWWMDTNGNPPAHYTIISADDIKAGIWTTRVPEFKLRSLAYAQELERNSSYQICAWPPHCLIGTPGACVHKDVNAELQKWSAEKFATVNYVTKGSNPWTEHYGALMAEVPDPEDPGTSLNTDFLKRLQESDIIAIGGLAKSHCVLETVRQIMNNIGDEHLRKIYIFEDCTASVPAVPNGPNFPQIADDFFNQAAKKGVTLTNSIDFLA